MSAGISQREKLDAESFRSILKLSRNHRSSRLSRPTGNFNLEADRTLIYR